MGVEIRICHAPRSGGSVVVACRLLREIPYRTNSHHITETDVTRNNPTNRITARWFGGIPVVAIARIAATNKAIAAMTTKIKSFRAAGILGASDMVETSASRYHNSSQISKVPKPTAVLACCKTL